MENVTVVIPTRNRWEKLKKTLDSILLDDWIRVFVVCDGDQATYDQLIHIFRDLLQVSVFLVKQHRGAVHSRNSVMDKVEDGVLYATDDVTFFDGSIKHALTSFNKRFPDDDGVVGFRQVPGSFHPTGVALVGKKFLERYPNKQLFFPDYFHFSCQEVHWLATELGKFWHEPKAVVEHLHPAFHKQLLDQTHWDARRFREQDLRMLARRQKSGEIWGLNND